MNALALVAGVLNDSLRLAVESLATLTPRRLALLARIVTLLTLLATLLVVGVRVGTDVGIGLPLSFLISTPAASRLKVAPRTFTGSGVAGETVLPMPSPPKNEIAGFMPARGSGL